MSEIIDQINRGEGNWIDIAILALIGLSIVIGIRAGLVKTFSVFIGLAGALLLTYISYKPISIIFEEYFIKWAWIKFLIFLLIFVAANFLVRRIGDIVEEKLEDLYLGFFNRIAGGVLAVAIASMIVIISLSLLSFIPKVDGVLEESIAGSQILQWIAEPQNPLNNVKPSVWF